jgi:hypothetical protein
LKTYLLVGNEVQSVEQINKSLVSIYNTKIYWFLKRCLDEDVHNRQLLFI